MRKQFLLLSSLLLTIYSSFSKDDVPPRRTCGTEMPSIQWQQDFKQKVEQFVAQQGQQRNNATYVIPVIVHVVYWNASENLSQAQVNSQINVLNADYAGTGFNVGNCPAAFQSLVANTNISFCAAAKDPNGNNLLEPGIDRVNAQTRGFTNPNGGWSRNYVTSTIKPATYWDPTKYLNIWVLPLGGGLLGYATFPGGASNVDGVVIGHTYYGNTGLVSAPYNRGRTTTHEVGHWLGLYHISGDEECGDDEVADTPPQRGNAGDGQGLNYGCPTFPHKPNSCTGTGSNGELFMNFMDYTDDACMFLFTPGQRERMQTVMTSFSMRSQLAASTTCNTTPQPPVANFIADKTSVCPATTVNFTDQSTNTPTSWAWSITPATGWSYTGGTSASSKDPKVIFNNIGNYTITLTATNALGSDGETKSSYITVANPTGVSLPFFEGFQSTAFAPAGWTLVSGSGFNWQRSTSAGGFGTSSASMFFNNFDNDGNDEKDDIITPVINLNGATNPRLKFDVAYARYSNNSTDTLEVLISSACATTQTSIYKKGGSALSTRSNIGSSFVPTATQWRTDSVFIPAAYLNQNVKIIFRNNGAFGNNIYVDNINLYGTTTASCTGTPTANFTSSATTICAGGTITFTNTSTVTSGSLDSVRWTIQGGSPVTSTSTTTVVPTFATAGSYTITLKAYRCGTVSTKTQNITVNPKPTVAAITGASAVCVGATTTLSSTTAGGVWSSTVPTVASVSTSGVVTGVSTGSTEIWYTVTSGGCSTTVIKFITVNAKPTVAAITGASAVCVGATTTLSSTTAGGVWSSTVPTAASVSTSGVVTGVSAGSTEIWYTVTSGGCSTTVIKFITVNARPNVTVTSPSVCAGSTATIQASGATSYTWSPNIGSTATVTTPVLTTTTTYTVTGTTGGCTKTAVSTVIVNTSAPTVTITPTPAASVCTGSSITLQAGGANNYTWSSSQTGTTSGATLTFVPNANITVNLSGTVTGCTAAGNTSINITLKPKPTVAATSPSVCPGQTAQPVASNAASYAWTGGLAAVANPVTPVLTTTTTYTVTGTAANGCTGTAVSVVTIKPVPATPAITQSHDTLYSSVIVAGATYEWYKAGVLQTTTSTPYYKLTSSGVYTVKVVNNGCSSASSANFNAVLTSIRNTKLEIQYAIIPNPNNGIFNLNITSPVNKTYQLKLYNISGQTIIAEDINLRTGQNNKYVNVAGMEKGVYFLSIIGDEGVSTQSVLIQ